MREGLIFRRDEQGASSVEYGLLVVAIAAVIAVVAFAFGATVVHLFHHTCDQIQTHAAVGSTCP